MHFRNDIYTELERHGINVAGSDPMRNMGAYLSADERFESLGKGMWGLTKWGHQRNQVDAVSSWAKSQEEARSIERRIQEAGNRLTSKTSMKCPRCEALIEAPMPDLDESLSIACPNCRKKVTYTATSRSTIIVETAEPLNGSQNTQ